MTTMEYAFLHAKPDRNRRDTEAHEDSRRFAEIFLANLRNLIQRQK